jgi:hypothetical protein
MATYIVTRHYIEEEEPLYNEHKALYPGLQGFWQDGRIIYDATPEGDDYIEGYGQLKQIYEYTDDAIAMANKIGGKYRRVR